MSIHLHHIHILKLYLYVYTYLPIYVRVYVYVCIKHLRFRIFLNYPITTLLRRSVSLLLTHSLYTTTLLHDTRYTLPHPLHQDEVSIVCLCVYLRYCRLSPITLHPLPATPLDSQPSRPVPSIVETFPTIALYARAGLWISPFCHYTYVKRQRATRTQTSTS
ncbi:uncharacterized protein F4807DRAFT_159476 [Annulohypoxylon truncatum]|uniref:uncharacterized protein n=1 Tax=Annulohypoxylon truncatum TaxID=327061 RepID=UPI0020072225|nr:uncharacterized protein F4807DRAFT_159476 [Annulohypoxylon truncatum]KAI1207943.1 hypothetical protein F4807DRAFT_159476 [Annulohypoxylon truncatum]